MLKRLAVGSRIGLQTPPMKALLYAMDRTRDASLIAEQIHGAFLELNGKVSLLETIVPTAKAYKEAATRRIPVRCHEVTSESKSDSAFQVMHKLVHELIPNLAQNHEYYEGIKDSR